MTLRRYFLYEWLGPARAHRRYLRRAYNAAEQLAGRLKTSFTSRGQRVLLCGVGRTVTAEYLCERLDGNDVPAAVTLFDLRPEVLDRARRKISRRGFKARIEICKGNALAMPFADGTFDWIETDHFLQFFRPDQLAGLAAEWRRVLSPGGLVTTRFFTPDMGQRGDRMRAAFWRFMSWILSAPCHIHPADKIVEAFEHEKFSVLTEPFPEWPHHRITSLAAVKDDVPGEHFRRGG